MKSFAHLARIAPLALALSAALAQAATPGDMLARYSSEARSQTPAFQPSPQRGAEFYARRFAASEKMPSCSTCHMEKPSLAGRHVVTDKAIKPLAPTANADRFSDPAKTEKWFGRNCKEVVGRECTPGEKADFVAYLMEGR